MKYLNIVLEHVCFLVGRISRAQRGVIRHSIVSFCWSIPRCSRIIQPTNCKLLLTAIVGMSLFTLSFANGASYVPSKMVKQENIKVIPKPYHRMITVYVQAGSLKKNIARIVRPYGWHTVWSLPFDYQFIGNMKIHASSVEGAIGTLLKNYPVQAIFYKGNRIVDIRSRAL